MPAPSTIPVVRPWRAATQQEERTASISAMFTLLETAGLTVTPLLSDYLRYTQSSQQHGVKVLPHTLTEYWSACVSYIKSLPPQSYHEALDSLRRVDVKMSILVRLDLLPRTVSESDMEKHIFTRGREEDIHHNYLPLALELWEKSGRDVFPLFFLSSPSRHRSWFWLPNLAISPDSIPQASKYYHHFRAHLKKAQPDIVARIKKMERRLQSSTPLCR